MDTIHCNTSVTSFGERGGRPLLTINEEKHAFDAVVAAIPSNAFARVAANHPAMSDTYRDQLASIEYLNAVVLVFTTREPITDIYWHQIHDTDAPFLVFLSLDSLIGTEKTDGRFVYYIGDYIKSDDPLMTASDEEICRRWFDGLRRIVPKFSPDLVTESHVFRLRNAQHIVDVGYDSRIPEVRTPLPGYFLVNFSQVFPDDRGTNYAVRDGLTVARMVDADIRR